MDGQFPSLRADQALGVARGSDSRRPSGGLAFGASLRPSPIGMLGKSGQRVTRPRIFVTGKQYWLDLNLPARGGLEVLAWIRQHPIFKKLVVVVFSSSALSVDIERACELGANSYITKPRGIENALEIAQLLKGWCLGYNHFAPIEIAPPIAGTTRLQNESPSLRAPPLEPVGPPRNNSAAGQTD